MIIDKDSLIAKYYKNGVLETINLGDYLTRANFGYYKQWGKDAGRNLAMSVVGTFNIFPKIVCYFKPLNQQELETISPLLNAQTQYITYYDPDYKQLLQMPTYTGDWAVDNVKVGLNETFNVSFISRNRRM